MADSADERPTAGQIRWADPRELRALPEADRDLLALDSELLAAAFLARCDFDVARAKEAIGHTAAWRKQSGASEVRKKLLEEPKISFSDFPHGPPVLKHFPQCEGGAAVDKRGLPYAIRCDEMLQFQTHLCEWRLLQLEDFARATGQLTGLLIVQDMFAPNGLLNAWRKHGSKSKIMRRLTSMMDEHYPGVMESVLLVNAPWAMHAILRILTPLLPQRVVKKLQVVPMAQTPEHLQQMIDESNLPEFLGGSAADAEFVPARAALVASGSGSELFIKAGQTEERSLDLQQGDIAAFGLAVANGLDILFGCHFESEEEAVEEVFPARRLQEESSSFSAPRDGRLVLTFDNSYSWVKPKDVRFELSKLLAEDDEAPAAASEGKALNRFRAELQRKRAELDGIEQQAARLAKERQEQEEQALLQASRHEEESRKRQEDLDRRKAELQQLEAEQEEAARLRLEEEKQREEELKMAQQALQAEREALQRQRQEQHEAEEKAASDRRTREEELADQQAHLEAQRKEVESCRQRGEAERDVQLQALQQHEAELKKHREELEQQRSEEEELRKAQAETFQLLDQELQDRALQISSSEEALASERQQILRSRGQLAMVQAHVVCLLGKVAGDGSSEKAMHLDASDEPEAELDVSGDTNEDGDEDMWNMDWSAVAAKRSEKSEGDGLVAQELSAN
eukprot:s554_g11.t1